MAVFFLGKSLPAVLSAKGAYGGMALFLPIFPVCLKRSISVVFAAPAAERSTESVLPDTFVGFAPAFPRYKAAYACAATGEDGVPIFPGAGNASGGDVCGG